jgi:tetratricopeptide (TPR) repeat protein
MKARFCPHCGAEASGEFNFCPNCGTKLPEFSGAVNDSTEALKAEPEAHVEQPSQRGADVQSASSTNEILICPTCGFQNSVGSRSCESCGSSLKGVAKSQSSIPVTSAKSDSIAAEARAPEQKNVRSQSAFPRKEKRKETKAPNVQQPSRKKFQLSTIQVTTIVAAILLGSIFVYGIVSTKSVAPQEGMPGGNTQQQTTTNQPSADVLNQIDRLRQVVDKNPSDLVSTLQLSNMLQDNSMYDQAAVYYKRYLAKIPDNVDARVDYGVTLYESGHTQDAIDQLNEAIKMNPKHQKAYFNLGIVYLNAGEVDKSNEALKKCVSIDPNSGVGKQAQQILQQHANIKN